MTTPDTETPVAGAAPELGDVVLEVRNLGVTFTGRVGMVSGLMGKKGSDARAVDGVSFDLRRGEVLALAGESGCGKTTTARAIMGLIKPDQGEILFEGAPVRNLRKYRRRVQMVFQDPMGSLNPRQTIYEIVAEALRIHGITSGPNGESEDELVARALSRAGMRPPERFYLLYPHELSGGQRQRVVIAGALVLEPEVIVADEPVSNLDASVRGEILALLMKLRDEDHISIIIVTHDLGLAWTVADRVAVMYLGRIVEVGPAEDVLTRPLHPYTQALLDVVPEAEGIDRPILAGEPPDPTRIPPGCRFHPRCPEVVTGSAAKIGVEDRCRGVDLGLDELRTAHFAACHLATAILREGAVPRDGEVVAPVGVAEGADASNVGWGFDGATTNRDGTIAGTDAAADEGETPAG
jgi:oligopeptide/dipeptide ABC transporter ATP-binding protein